MNKGKNITSPIVSYRNHKSARLERTNYAFSPHIFNWDFQFSILCKFAW